MVSTVSSQQGDLESPIWLGSSCFHVFSVHTLLYVSPATGWTPVQVCLLPVIMEIDVSLPATLTYNGSGREWMGGFYVILLLAF